MSKKIKNFNTIWEKIYKQGHIQLYPWDIVVSFIFKNLPSQKSRKNVRILELGFGTGSNLWFAAREGFEVYGIEASKTALSFARKRLKAEMLKCDLRHGDFSKIPFKSQFFDLIIDRCSLACTKINIQKKAINECKRVLKKGGRILHNTYTDNHSSFIKGKTEKNGLTAINSGSLKGVGNLHFTSFTEIEEKFNNGWKLKEIQRKELFNLLASSNNMHTEWIVVAEKI